MYDQSLEDLSRLVSKAAAGLTTVTKGEVYGRIREAARRLGKPGDSIERSMCKLFYDRNAPYSAIYKGYCARPGTSTIAKIEQPGYETYENDHGGGVTPNDGPSFSELVDRHQASHPEMSRSSSIDRILATNEGRKSIMVEKRNRLARVMGG
jgi:hypothetical protein